MVRLFQFDLKRVTNHSSRLKVDMLEECNRLEICAQIEDPAECPQLVKQVQEIVRQTFPKEADKLDLDENHIRHVLQRWANERLTSLQQLVDPKFYFLWILPDLKNLDVDANFDVDKLIEALERTEFNEEQLQTVLNEFRKEHNLKTRPFMVTLRAVLSGLNDGPGVREIMSILGRKTTIDRLHRLKSKAKSK